MKRLTLLAVVSGLISLAAGCGDAPPPPAKVPGTPAATAPAESKAIASTAKSSAAKTQSPERVAAVAAVKALGGKIEYDDNHAVAGVDLRKIEVTDDQLAPLDEFPGQAGRR